MAHEIKVKADDRWMNDSEASRCLGCNTEFSFLLRKVFASSYSTKVRSHVCDCNEHVTPDLNSSYRSYQRFEHINEAKGKFFFVLTLKPRLHVAVNKGGFARGRNCDSIY